MARRIAHARTAWLVAGLLAGMLLASLWPTQPTFAVATDRMEQFSIATGTVTPGLEAIYVLDFVTGELQALLLDRQTGRFTVRVARNVANDFFEVRPRQTPQYLMVTGDADLRTGGQVLATAVLYVAELTTGQLVAYTFPFAGDRLAGPQHLPFSVLDTFQFREVGGAGGGAN